MCSCKSNTVKQVSMLPLNRANYSTSLWSQKYSEVGATDLYELSEWHGSFSIEEHHCAGAKAQATFTTLDNDMELLGRRSVLSMWSSSGPPARHPVSNQCSVFAFWVNMATNISIEQIYRILCHGFLVSLVTSPSNSNTKACSLILSLPHSLLSV